MSVGSLDALKVRALLERVCSVPTTLTPDELSRVCAAQLSFAEVVSLAAQLTAVIRRTRSRRRRRRRRARAGR